VIECLAVTGIHYSSEVYSVIAQMTANSYTLRFPSNYVKPEVSLVPASPPIF
jgi:hypothetical protein